MGFTHKNLLVWEIALRLEPFQIEVSSLSTISELLRNLYRHWCAIFLSIFAILLRYLLQFVRCYLVLCLLLLACGLRLVNDIGSKLL